MIRYDIQQHHQPKIIKTISFFKLLVKFYTFKYCGGFMKQPTPGGVPVTITSPGNKVKYLLI